MTFPKRYIAKFRLKVTPIQYVVMPEQSQLLSVTMCGNVIFLHAIVPAQSNWPKVRQRIHMLRTAPLPDSCVQRTFLGQIESHEDYWYFFNTGQFPLEAKPDGESAEQTDPAQAEQASG